MAQFNPGTFPESKGRNPLISTSSGRCVGVKRTSTATNAGAGLRGALEVVALQARWPGIVTAADAVRQS